MFMKFSHAFVFFLDLDYLFHIKTLLTRKVLPVKVHHVESQQELIHVTSFAHFRNGWISVCDFWEYGISKRLVVTVDANKKHCSPTNK